ncbi:MAG: alginate lyase family protein [Solirubrobacterales bacterium]|nr:alginate lyase family protein [Solirubrobacterales bacterium]
MSALAGTARRVGPHPVRLGLAVGERLLEPRRQRRLRRTYAGRISSPAEHATLHAPLIELASQPELPSELRQASAGILGEAEAALEHRVDLLGSGLVPLGPQIDWHADFKSGYRWPVAFYQDVEVTRLDDDSDAKVPWELSRGHQLLTLARAARLYEDERFARELEVQLTDWLAANPPGQGINWVNAMEVAIRAVNWLWAIGTLEQWRPLDPVLRDAVTRSLQVHGRHIAANLEGTQLLRGNHYLSDLLGLLALGAFLEGDTAAKRWLRFAQRELEREILAQVLPDGVGFEGSLPYHGLAMEIFLLGWLISMVVRRPLSSRYRVRLERMLEVSRSVRHPDGRSPVFGDQDSGRVLPGGSPRPPTHDNLLDLGSVLLELPRLVPGRAPHPEVAWTLGVPAWKEVAERAVTAAPPRTAFADGGLYLLAAGDLHAVVRWGGVGQRGRGGHGHNDLSSYELSYGVPFIVDSGTYLYTADPLERDAFRSARAHNVVVVDGLDMHPLPPAAPFQMPAHASFSVQRWRQSELQSELVGWHDGYRRDGVEVVCRRAIELSNADRALTVIDDVEGRGRRAVESLVHLAPGVQTTAVGDDQIQLTHRGRGLTITFSGARSVAVEQGWVSDRYGVRDRSPLLRATVEAELPVRLSYRISPR